MRTLAILILIINLSFAKNRCEDKFFSFNTSSYKDGITILDLLENLVGECKMTMLIEDDVTKKALRKKLSYINITDYSVRELFDLFLTDHNLFYTYDTSKGILKISYLETKSFYIDYVNFKSRKSQTKKTIKTGSGGTGGGKAGSGSDNEDMIESITEFDFWGRIEKDIKALLQRDEDKYHVKAKVFINPEAGLVTTTGTKKQLDRVVKYIDTLLERVHKQIMIEAKIMEVVYTDQSSTGIDWSKFDVSFLGNANAAYSAEGSSVLANTLNMPINTFGYNFDMNGFISFLKKKGDVTVVSNPKILTLNNQPAIINVGDQINYRYQTGEVVNTSGTVPTITVTYELDSVFIGVTLNIVPEVTKDGFIILKINPMISSFRNTTQMYLDADTIRSIPPDIKIKQLSSIVKVKNGNRVVIGGLITTSNTVDTNKVPLLGDVPFFGYAFKSKKNQKIRSELILVITPKIIDGTTNISLDELDSKFKGAMGK